MKNNSRLYQAGFSVAIILLVLTCVQCEERTSPKQPDTPGLSYLLTNNDLQQFGEKLFFDKTLSDPEGQSCASCHGPEVGWTGPNEGVNKMGGVYPGAMHSSQFALDAENMMFISLGFDNGMTKLEYQYITPGVEYSPMELFKNEEMNFEFDDRFEAVK